MGRSSGSLSPISSEKEGGGARTLAASKSRWCVPTDSAASIHAPPGTLPPATQKPPCSPLLPSPPRAQPTPIQGASPCPVFSPEAQRPLRELRIARSSFMPPSHRTSAAPREHPTLSLRLCSAPALLRRLPRSTEHEGCSNSSRSWTRWPHSGGETPARLTIE